MRAYFGILLAGLLHGGTLAAEPVHAVPYDTLRSELTERIDFERLPQRAEPGFNLDLPVYARGAWLGERFAGQSLRPGGDGRDRLDAAPPETPLRIAAGRPGRNLAISLHAGFGSNAVFPVGADGFPAITARGEGTLAVLFDDDQAALGFRVHADYADPLGARPAPPGQIVVSFHSRDGRLLARLRQDLAGGVLSFGYRRAESQRDIAGVTIENTDPGGIAVDDIIFAKPPLLG